MVKNNYTLTKTKILSGIQCHKNYGLNYTKKVNIEIDRFFTQETDLVKL